MIPRTVPLPMLVERVYTIAFLAALLASVWGAYLLIGELVPELIGEGVRGMMVATKAHAGRP